jgi:hypothetical protein
MTIKQIDKGQKVIELSQGTNGKGHPVWLVTTVKKLDCGGEKVLWVEYFDNLPEAENWIQWAC